MSISFHTRLREYYLKVAEVLKGNADAASVFPNTTDIGIARERVYADFLEQHAPSKCNVFLGGFLFHMDGRESKQLDVIITTDTAPRFNFHNRNGEGKSFSPVEGTLGVVSIKSTLDKQQLYDSLFGIASIPPSESLDNRVLFGLNIKHYDDWPCKVIYATDGLRAETVFEHLNTFYVENPDIPVNRRPHVIHVVGKYAIFRITPDMVLKDPQSKQITEKEVGSFQLTGNQPDLQAIIWVLNGLQGRASASSHIIYRYGDLINNINEMA